MSGKSYVISEDGEKYPVDSVIGRQVIESIPGYACGISLDKDDYNDSLVGDKPVTNSRQEVEIKTAQTYLETLRPPEKPKRLHRQTNLLHRALYPLYEYIDTHTTIGSLIESVIVSSILTVLFGFFDIYLGLYVGGGAFLLSLWLACCSYCVAHSVKSYITQKQCYWIDEHNNTIVQGIVRRVRFADDTNPDLLVELSTEYGVDDKFVELDALIFTEDEIANWRTYFEENRKYLKNWNIATLQMYYPGYAEDKLFLQYMQDNAQYDAGKLCAVEQLVKDYIEYLKDLQERYSKQQAIVNDIQTELKQLNGNKSLANVILETLQ